MLSGCAYSSFKVPDEYKDKYIAAARGYLADKYPDLDIEDASVTVYDTYSSVNKHSVCVTFYTDNYNHGIDVWNVLTYPLDNVATVLYSDTALAEITELAVEVFGADIIIKPLPDGAIGSKDTKVYSDATDFLSVHGNYPFIVGCLGSESGKRDLISEFNEKLHKQGVFQDYIFCLYSDLSTMRQDLRSSDSTTFTESSCANWLTVIDGVAGDWLGG